MRLTCRNIHVGKSGHISTIPVFKMFFKFLIFFIKTYYWNMNRGKNVRPLMISYVKHDE